MTTTTGGHAGPFARFSFWLSHYQAVLMIAAAAADAVSTFLWWGALILLALMGLFVASTLGAIRHLDEICVVCAHHFPLNPSAEARGRRRRALRRFHYWAPRLRWYAAGGLIALMVSWVPGLWWLRSTVWLMSARLVSATRWHRMLRPYCPYCPGGGGDSPSEVPTPTPVAQGII